MEKVKTALEELKKINLNYGIDIAGINRLQEEMAEAKVCTPIIGKFSSGKSALVNTVLGYRKNLLKEDVTPETAIPAEIVYNDAEDMITVIKKDGTCNQLSVEEYRGYDAEANKVKCVRIRLRNSFLKEIPDVMLVDMPGFESGFEVHNRAIDDYLPQSLAYIIAFPADDMILRSSVGNILKELCIHDMPLCVVITKYDKRNDSFEVTFEKLKESIKRFVGDREIRYCRTSSFIGDAEELEVFLKEVQEESQEILGNKYKKLIIPVLENTQNYLITSLNGSQLSESELGEKEERLKGQLSSLNSRFSRNREDFDKEIAECAEEIKADVQRALTAEESTFVAMALNKQDIQDHLNFVVRNAVTVSVKKNLIPKIEKYLKRVADTINSETVGDVHVSFAYDAESLKKGITGEIVALAAAFVVGPIFALLAGLLAGIIMKISGDKKREEARQVITQKLRTEVFPKVLEEVGRSIDTTVTKQVDLVNTSIEEELASQRSTLEKAMSDLREQMNNEKIRKENLEIDIKTDLERIEEIKDGLR